MCSCGKCLMGRWAHSVIGERRKRDLHKQVSANFKAGDGLQSTYDWLVLFCSMLGSKFFGLGCAASFILGNNLDYTQQLDAWKAQGKLGHPPRSV